MAKLYFRYAAMGAGKSSQLLQVRHNYKERGQRVCVLQPAISNRDGVGVVSSRIGGFEKISAKVVDTTMNLWEEFSNEPAYDCILVDESQFLSREQVYQLARIVDLRDTPVICYGLRADFRGDLFPGSAALLAVADTLEELKTICWCGKKAIMNARIVEGQVVYEGEQVLIGGNESYMALCRKHWANNNIGQDIVKVLHNPE